MLIVKGKNGKSVLVNVISDITHSICFEYHDYPVFYNSYCVDSEEYYLSEFIECIEEEFNDLMEDGKHYDYLIIYTNKKEEELKELIDWLNENKHKICCLDIIVMCKE